MTSVFGGAQTVPTTQNTQQNINQNTQQSAQYQNDVAQFQAANPLAQQMGQLAYGQAGQIQNYSQGAIPLRGITPWNPYESAGVQGLGYAGSATQPLISEGAQNYNIGSNYMTQAGEYYPYASDVLGQAAQYYPYAANVMGQGLQYLPQAAGMVAQGASYVPGAANMVAQGAAYTPQAANMIGQGAAYMPGAASMIGAGAQYVPQGAQYMAAGAGYMPESAQMMRDVYSPITGQDVAGFYNPFAQNVTDNLMNIFGQQNLASRVGGTAQSGGTGADRTAVAQSLLAKQQGLTAGQVYSDLYQRALQAAQQQKAQQMGAAQGLAGVGTGLAGIGGQYGNLGGILGGLGTQYGGLGSQLAGMGTQYGALGQGLAGMGTQYGGLGSQLAGMGTQYGGIGTSIAGVGTQYGALGQGLAGVAGQYGQLGAGLGSLGQNISGTGLAGVGAGISGQQAALAGGQYARGVDQQTYDAYYQRQQQAYEDLYRQMQTYTGALPGMIGLGYAGGQTGTGTANQAGAVTGSQTGTGVGATTYPAPNLFGQLVGAGTAAAGLFGALSDRRKKTDIESAGKDPNSGLPLYAYRYKADPKTYPKVVGPMAQDVEKKYPDMVQHLKKRAYGGGVDDEESGGDSQDYLAGDSGQDQIGGSDDTDNLSNNRSAVAGSQMSKPRPDPVVDQARARQRKALALQKILQQVKQTQQSAVYARPHEIKFPAMPTKLGEPIKMPQYAEGGAVEDWLNPATGKPWAPLPRQVSQYLQQHDQTVNDWNSARQAAGDNTPFQEGEGWWAGSTFFLNPFYPGGNKANPSFTKANAVGYNGPLDIPQFQNEYDDSLGGDISRGGHKSGDISNWFRVPAYTAGASREPPQQSSQSSQPQSSQSSQSGGGGNAWLDPLYSSMGLSSDQIAGLNPQHGPITGFDTDALTNLGLNPDQTTGLQTAVAQHNMGQQEGGRVSARRTGMRLGRPLEQRLGSPYSTNIEDRRGEPSYLDIKPPTWRGEVEEKDKPYGVYADGGGVNPWDFSWVDKLPKFEPMKFTGQPPGPSEEGLGLPPMAPRGGFPLPLGRPSEAGPEGEGPSSGMDLETALPEPQGPEGTPDEEGAGFTPRGGRPGGGGGLAGAASNPYMALLQAGLGMMAASGERDRHGLPMSGLAAIGKGGMKGVEALQEQRAFDLKQRVADENAALRRMQIQDLHENRLARRADREFAAVRPAVMGRDENGDPVYGIYNRDTKKWEKQIAEPASPFSPEDTATPEGQAAKPKRGDALAKAIANYDAPPLSPRAQQTPRGQALFDKIIAHNPDYQAGEYSNRNKAKNAFNIGVEGRTLGRFNTYIAHSYTLESALEELEKANLTGNYRIFNAISQRIADETGHPAPRTFDAIRSIYGNEAATATVGTQNALGDRQELKEEISRTASPQALRSIMAAHRELAGGHVRSLKTRYESATKAKDFDDKLLPESLAALNKTKAFRGHTESSAPFGSEKEKEEGATPTIPQGAIDLLKSKPTPEMRKEFERVFKIPAGNFLDEGT